MLTLKRSNRWEEKKEIGKIIRVSKDKKSRLRFDHINW